MIVTLPSLIARRRAVGMLYDAGRNGVGKTEMLAAVMRSTSITCSDHGGR